MHPVPPLCQLHHDHMHRSTSALHPPAPRVAPGAAPHGRDVQWGARNAEVGLGREGPQGRRAAFMLELHELTGVN